MNPRYRLAAILSLFALVLVTSAAFAAKPAPVVSPIISGTEIENLTVAPPRYTHTVCTLGEVGAPGYIVDYLLPPGDGYYTLVDPSACGCAGGSVLLTNIKMALNFRVVCAQPVTIQVVGATGDAACYAPDPSNVLCPPQNYLLSPAAPGNFLFTMPITSDCCISGPAYIVVTFGNFPAACNTSARWPRLLTTLSCVPCESYNIWPGGADELCGIGFPGNPVMQADADCCNVTPTHRNTWGGMKILYR